MNLYTNIQQFIKKYLRTLVGILFLGIVIVSVTLLNDISRNIEYIQNQININIREYNSIDLTHLYGIVACSEISTKYQKTNLFEKKEFEETSFIQIYNDIYIDLNFSDFNIIFYNYSANGYFRKNYTEFIYTDFKHLSMIFVIFSIMFIIMMYKTYIQERSEAMIQSIGKEAILANKSMVMITENVHHELNTPIEVIENKMERIHRTVNRYLISQNDWQMQHNVDRRDTPDNRMWNKKFVKLEKDFDFVHTSIEQILSVLSKMKNFKSLRYSNGDKTVNDIIEGAFRIISVSNTDIDYSIDSEFNDFKMQKDSLKNIDLLNILINHIKNSIEANSTTIKINKGRCTPDNILRLVITDNGSGIPEHLRKDVFKPNFSSKQIGDSIRGNGMHLNKHIINEFGGDIKVLQTSENGTSIEISFPAQKSISTMNSHI